MLFLETESSAKSLSTKTVRALVFEISIQLWASQPGIALQPFSGPLIRWVNNFEVPAESDPSWAKYESLMHADLYRVAPSLFRMGLFLPSNTNLSCRFSRGVLTILVFTLHPDSLMMSGACLKSSSMCQYCQSDLSQL